MRNFNKQSGQVSRIILILAGAVLLISIVVFIAVSIVGSRRAEPAPDDTTIPKNEPPKPVYEAAVGDIHFILQSSVDLGSVLKSDKLYVGDLITTERFIRVIIGAQNKGKNETSSFAWELGNIVDSEGRNFIASKQVYYFLPQPDLCGAILKPEFTPVQCVRIYEVSKKSTGLKIEAISKSQKQGKALLDLNLIY